MQRGRPAKHPRTAFGERLFDLRQRAGLSQQALATRIGVTQRAYAHWERNPVALRPEQLERLADALNVSIERLFGEPSPGAEVTGEMVRLSQQVSNLPTAAQHEIAEWIEAYLRRQGRSRR